MATNKLSRRFRIKRKIRGKISGTPERPRFAVFRSNNEIYAQVIDDVNGKTLAAASSRDKGLSASGNKVDKSKAVGSLLAERATAAGVSNVVFDRGGYLFHGRVKALADSAREGGLKF